MGFDEYLITWYRHLIDNHMEDESWCRNMFKVMHCNEFCLKVGMSCYGVLGGIDDEECIWSELLGNKGVKIDGVPDVRTFLTETFCLLGENLVSKYKFAKAFIEDFINEYLLMGFSQPLQWFESLPYDNGAYMLNMFSSDRKKRFEFYAEYMDSLEEYKERLELVGGECVVITNANHWSHDAFIIDICYRNFANEFAKILWPKKFKSLK